MATTQIADVIVPAVFNPYLIARTMTLSALYRAGIISTDPVLNERASGPSNLVNMPFWNDLTGRSNVGSDNPASASTPEKIGASKDVAQKHFRNKSWSTMDLAGILAGADPMKAIGDLVAGYWARDMQTTLISTLDGVIADNVAANGGDMVLNVATDAVGAITAAEKISGALIIAAKQTMGDAGANLTAIAMHSVLHSQLQTQGLIATIPGDQANIGWGTYLGYTVVVDDGCPAVAGVNRVTYTSYLFGRGAIGYGEGSPKVPTAVTRDEAAGDGEGMEVLHNRKHFILHPRGIKWTQTAMVGQGPTDAEMQDATNWSRVYERKMVRLAVIKTNG